MESLLFNTNVFRQESFEWLCLDKETYYRIEKFLIFSLIIPIIYRIIHQANMFYKFSAM
jgi:hypothetical protein